MQRKGRDKISGMKLEGVKREGNMSEIERNQLCQKGRKTKEK